MQTTLQNKEDNRKQVISLVFLICSIVIGFFFTLDQGYGYIEKKDTLDATKKEVIEKKTMLEVLQNTTKNIENSVELQNDIARYGSEFREDAIIDSIFTPINGVNIANISMSKGEKTPNGLSLANISLLLKAQDRATLGNYLNYLTSSETNKKSYIIKSLNFPLDTTRDTPISVNLELSMYYFE
ncbi:hypothetical protein GW819_02885 [Candidatus Gracilibacteria bacterium]|nr:hypothetical protein [bacterium]NDK19759.1 hypothetical protein [Candidatus Gracilibacteria bacterium]OIO77068.1 MAG: hypothetical protein AUJ87_01855 [Candidatus Gracilibacteria bacterium CG1_02_38_174]PIQ11547.1 MAG: hypothetical protein COW68_02425 [Candidatus Gracilibacteria bacterium CG18_big_fil_WC_8_21_14_2_50_38_16]PIQ42285.1 MAG: hypothetical protein COW06_00055 [Candidatus Gracilibacteria bacterium CG12_big_fil_rev_8_21_14_0_65_38_15]PIZ02037.1 MAG: hypothetical protein COY60_0048